MLTAIFDFLFHRHSWQIYEESDLVQYNEGRRMVVGKLFVLKCSKCGKIKSETIESPYI